MGSSSTKWLVGLNLTQPVDAATTERIFNEYDKDRNGYLDASEAKLFVAEWCKHYNVKDPCHAVQSFFDTFDADGDGRISKAELIGKPPLVSRERSKPVTGPPPPSPRGHVRLESSPFVVPSKESLDVLDWEVKFRRCAITRDRHFHLKKYPDCFTGNETVDMLVGLGYAKNRTEALFYGNFLMETGLFMSVSREQTFKDEGQCYQFANRQQINTSLSKAEVRAVEALHERYLANKDDEDDVIIVEL